MTIPNLDIQQPVASLDRTELKDLLIPIRRHLHQHPELGFQEVETSNYIRHVLEAYHLEVKGPLAGTGLYVDIEGTSPGPGVGYRADIDALPIQDVKEVEYASKSPGLGHLCGHDVHTTIAIGVALSLNELRSHFPGRVRVFFQPNEEGMPSGAPDMIRDHVLDGLQAVYAVHADPTLPVGQFGLKVGPITAATHAFVVRIKSHTTGHSARPHQSIDTIWIATQIINTLYQIVGRVHDTRNSAILTVCRLQAGKANNVIPKEVEFGGTLRCIDHADQMHLIEHIKKISRQIAQLYGAEVEIDIPGGAPPVVNDEALIKNVDMIIRDLYGESAIFQVPIPSMGAEDFAHYLDHVPGALIRIGTSDGPATRHPLHDSRFDVAEDALPLATELMTHVLIRYLKGARG